MMPHMARWLVGADHRWSLPSDATAAPALLLLPILLVVCWLLPGELRVSVVSASARRYLFFWYAVNRSGGVRDVSFSSAYRKLPA